MCLLLFSYKEHPRYHLILASNRDEFKDRKTRFAHFWDDYPQVLAGQDQQAGGTWLGMTKTGCFSALTNFRKGQTEFPDNEFGVSENRLVKKKSRGNLVRNYLVSAQDPFSYLFAVSEEQMQYDPFNLITADKNKMFFYSSHNNLIHELEAGVYGLSNHLLDTPWPKLITAKQAFESCLTKDALAIEALFSLLQDTTAPEENDLPDTGIDFEWEKRLGPVFITGKDYGTVSSTVILWDYEGNVHYLERLYNANSRPEKTREFKFKIVK